tara:strand:+ start:2245 stop:2949 length:705 start_codon:yes stop_codon:yes gene_type:complete
MSAYATQTTAVASNEAAPICNISLNASQALPNAEDRTQTAEETLKTFEKTELAYEDEMMRMCEYFRLVDTLSLLEAKDTCCEETIKPKLVKDAQIALDEALTAKTYREERAEISSKAQQYRLRVLREELGATNAKDKTSLRAQEEQANRARIQDEINKLSEGVQLSGWYTAMSYMMYYTGRPFFSLVELPREYTSLHISEDVFWNCPFGLSSHERWRAFVNDNQYAALAKTSSR